MLAVEVDIWSQNEGEWTDLNSQVEVKLIRGRKSLNHRYKPDSRVYLDVIGQHHTIIRLGATSYRDFNQYSYGPQSNKTLNGSIRGITINKSVLITQVMHLEP